MSFLDILSAMRGHSLQISLDVEDGVFEYGKTIDVCIELHGRNHIKVKNARLDLVMERRYAETFTRQVPGRGHSGIFLPAKKTLMIPKQEVVEKSEITVLDSSDLIFDSTSLRRGESLNQKVSIRIPNQIPYPDLSGYVYWSLKAVVDIESDDDFSEMQSISRSLKILIEHAKDGAGQKSPPGFKEYLSYLKPDQTAEGKKRFATIWTAITLVSLCVLALGGELYRPLDYLWTLALILCVLGIGVALWLGISGRREFGGGIMQGIGIGLAALSLTWFDISSVLFFLDYFGD